MNWFCLLLMSTALVAAGADRPKMPEVTRPVLFNTPEADEILAALPGFSAGQPLERRHLLAAGASQLGEDDRQHRGRQEVCSTTST